ncbi:MAG: hypothetical protein KGZ83_19150 [Sulfuricella sp.]|nr:hypothetical protein [Sulfuricella sp.]
MEFPGAIYHVTARGNARAAIFLDDEDRSLFLAVLSECVKRFGWLGHAYSKQKQGSGLDINQKQGSGLDINHTAITLPT